MSTRAFLTFNPELEVPNYVDAACSDDITDADEVAELPFNSGWKLWEQIANDSQRDYTDNMKPISSFDTVQQFWQLWNLLPQPSQLMSDKRMVRETSGGQQLVDAIMVFRDDVKPMWEDPLNASGGHFEVRYGQTRDPDELARLDEHWNNLVLAMVGATLAPQGVITGVRLVDKLHSGGRGGGFIRIEIWFSDLTAIPDGKNMLRGELERVMTTKLDGSRDPSRVTLTMKSHQKGAK